MTYSVLIRDNMTGEERSIHMDGEWSGASWWTDGNGACDCNRGSFFAEAGGLDTDALSDDEDEAMFPCGHRRYVVPHATLADGVRIAIDAAA